MSKATRPSVSVVMCTFNGERFVAEQLESILAQTFPPNEIIISDDGSSDRTLQVVESIRGASDLPVRWSIRTRETPLGPARNFESALRHATGDLIALADQDVVWLPHKLETLTGRLTETPGALLVHSDAQLTYELGRQGSTLMKALALTKHERQNLLSGNALGALLKRNLVTGATTMVTKGLRDSALPIPDGWVHDEWLGLVAALQDGVVFDESPLILYRQHGGNVIGAQQLEPAVAQERLQEPRAAFSARKARRNEALLALLHAEPAGLPPHHREALQAKVDFDAARATLPDAHLARVIPVVRWAFAGLYRDFARGWIDVIRDLALRP